MAAARRLAGPGDPARLAAVGDLFMAARAWADAAAAYRAALDLRPDAMAAWNNLGGALRELGRLPEADEAYRRALALDPGRYEAWANLAATLSRAGSTDEAIAAWERAAALRPGDVAPVRALAGLLRSAGRHREALAAHERWAALAPGEAAAHHGCGILLDEAGRLEEGIAALERASRLAPDHADLHYDLGRALRRAHRDQSAIAALRTAVRLDPGHAEALSALGAVLWQAKNSTMALEAFRRAAAARPDHPEVLARLANALHAFGRQDEGRAVFARALARDPGNWSLRYQACVARLPIVYRDEAERQAARRDYARELAALAAEPLPDDAAEVARRAEALHVRQPFYLAYQGENDRDLQALFGAMACRIMAARLPAFAAPPEPPGLAAGERIRVGVLTAFFRHHSVWKIPLHSWLADLDRERFQVLGYFPGGEADRETATAERLCDRFTAGPFAVDQWARRIRADRLHVLLIPEIGMDATTMQLAALRLAPVQATSWGHPQTSGMPTVDAFLSSDLMEPPDGDRHYTERLVRLPGLSFRRSVPPVRPEPIGRADIGVEEDAVLYWCCQSLYKYLPADDGVLVRIAAAVPGARFVFVGYPMGDQVGDLVRRRLGAAFAAAGLDAGRHCRFLGHLPSARFAAVARLADVFLDSIGWSGCNSTLESLDADLPVVTWPGRSMRARHSAAILRLMGIEETIAASADDYVALAVRLGRDAEWRRAVRGRIAAARHVPAADRSWLPAFESFLAAAAHGRSN
ncbi:tetratricopeptide repeat protein [Stella sp.]|uniref:tetratricopeptide repeat protein n=1 Tax=Stella sp. TaxID=2912054 RepID=UPI0035AE6582